MEKAIKNEMSALGCQCGTKVALAYQLYLELCEVKLMYDVNYFYSAELDVIYLTARNSEGGKVQTFIPHLTSNGLKLRFVDNAQRLLCQSDESDGRVTMAFMESDSTVTFYTFTNGLIDIKDREAPQRHRKKEEMRELIDADLRKNKVIYAKMALENGMIGDS